MSQCLRKLLPLAIAVSAAQVPLAGAQQLEEEVVYDLSGFGFQYNMPRMYGVDVKLDF